ncbi:MAG: tRNA (N6-threonylcarbamoyladenosine(37)-N6)-methyltransferase TrmO [Ruminococcaceae bacterium]|nr:tRNA (N6-threonylcarbamoyladenosine(37)-N6)-methyltransferase TrmO [Oscillospiraceae bacterium]
MDIKITSIGTVSNRVSEKKDVSWGEDISQIILDEKYRGGLSGLEDFSHAVIVYYLDKANFDIEKHLTRKPQNREDMPLVGIFSQRAKDRPNRLAMTAVSIVSVEEDRLTVRGLDAIDSTPVIDIKPYYPMYDCKNDARVPEWVERLMEHYF